MIGLSVNYPDTKLMKKKGVPLASEDLPHCRLCPLTHVGTVRLATMVDVFDATLKQTSVCPACVAGKLTRSPLLRTLELPSLWLLHTC